MPFYNSKHFRSTSITSYVFFIPKVLVKDQKMLDLKIMKNPKSGPFDLCGRKVNVTIE